MDIKHTLKPFGNERYQLLKFLDDNKEYIEGEKRVKLSQQAIADKMHWSKLKTNKIITELIKLKCIERKKGIKGYIINEDGDKVLDLFKKEY